MTIIRLALVLAFITVTSPASYSNFQEDNSITLISMINLLTDPNSYDDLQGYVSTVGFLSVDGRVLFLTSDHAKLNDGSSGIFISPPSASYLKSTCLGQYVRITGKFAISSANDLRLKDFILVQVHDEEWITKDCWKATESD